MIACCKTLLPVFLLASCAFSFPTAGKLDIEGPSNFVGAFTITPLPNTGKSQVSGYGGAYNAALSGLPGITNTVGCPTGMTTCAIRPVYCDDFSNDVSIPSGVKTVNYSQILDSSNITDSRFGAVPTNVISNGSVTGRYWLNVANFCDSSNIKNGVCTTGPTGTNVTNATASYIDTLSALQRYQMAAWLTTQYSFGVKNAITNTYYSDAQDTGIQSAIWALLDVVSTDGTANTIGVDYSLPCNTGSTCGSKGQDGSIATWLTNAVNWYKGSTLAGRNSLLAGYMIATDSTVATQTTLSKRLNTGIQEFITTPEPGFYALLSLALLAFWALRRSRRAI